VRAAGEHGWADLTGPELCILDWESWRRALASRVREVLGDLMAGACAYFRTESFSAGVRLVQAISQMAEDRRPAVDIRHDGVTVRLAEPDLELVRRISAVAQELGVPADPSGVQKIQVSIDALVISEVMPFWRAAGASPATNPHQYYPCPGLRT
jgi:hypothetical protein